MTASNILSCALFLHMISYLRCTFLDSNKLNTTMCFMNFKMFTRILPHGCCFYYCRCDHEFCYSCGSDYINSEKTCQCAFDLDEYSEDEIETYPPQQYEQWAWESFMSLPSSDTYSEQERSQLALIQRFLSGGFSSTDHQPYQSPPRCTDSYMDTMKDLRQLPWLERFVSVISDSYYEEYVQ